MNNIEYAGKDSVQLHSVYGINCYQNAIGYKPITTHFNETSGKLSYLVLSPGNTAQILHDHFSKNPTSQVPPKEMIKLLISQCREDQLEELETRTLSDPINVPENKRLIAMLYSNELQDFDFHYHDPKSNMWKNKTPLEEYSEREDVPRLLGGGYVLSRFFIAPENIQPKGVPKGIIHSYEDQDVILNLPEALKSWEKGPCFQQTADGFYRKRTDKTYASPDLSFSKS